VVRGRTTDLNLGVQGRSGLGDLKGWQVIILLTSVGSVRACNETQDKHFVMRVCLRRDMYQEPGVVTLRRWRSFIFSASPAVFIYKGLESGGSHQQHQQQHQQATPLYCQPSNGSYDQLPSMKGRQARSKLSDGRQSLRVPPSCSRTLDSVPVDDLLRLFALGAFGWWLSFCGSLNSALLLRQCSTRRRSRGPGDPCDIFNRCPFWGKPRRSS